MNARWVWSRPHCPTVLLITVWATFLIAPAPAGAHGVEVVAELDGRPATLELTDETGEVCVRFDSDIDPADQISVASAASGEVVLELGNGFGVVKTCQFLDPDVVDTVLADVDGYELIRRQSDGTVTRAPLQKPRAPATETSLTEGASVDTAEDDGGPNLPLVFAVGAVAGVGVAVWRKRSRSRRS